MTVLGSLLHRRGSAKLSQFLACITANIVTFTVGIQVAWTGPSLPKILSEEYPHDVTSDEASYIAIISSIGYIIGAFLGCALSDLIGRKYTLLAVALPQVSSLILIYFSYIGIPLLYCARVLGGIGEGAAISVIAIYMSEVASPDLRGSIGTLSTLFARSGCLFINLLGSYTDIHTAAIICLLFPLLHWLCFIHFPDSPYYLLMKGNTERARECIKVLRSTQDVEKEMVELTADVSRQMSESGRYWDLIVIDSNRKALILSSAARGFQILAGGLAFMNYYQILIAQTTNLSPVMGSSLIFLTQILMACLATKFADKFGRKSLLTTSSGLTSLVLLIMGVYFSLRDYTDLDMSSMQWFPLPMMMVLIVTFFLGMELITPIFISELFSTVIKAKAVSLVGVVYAVSTMASTKFYQYTADNLGLAVPFYGFSACTFVGMLFYVFKMPETKGKTLELIQQELKGNKPKSLT